MNKPLIKTSRNSFFSSFTKSSTDTDLLVGEALVKKGVIDEEQLQHALNEQFDRLSHTGQTPRIATVIKELGYASEKALLKNINEHYNLNATSLTDNIENLVDAIRSKPQEKLPRVPFPIWLKLSVAITSIVLLVSIALGVVTLNRQQKQLHDQMLKIGRITVNYFVNNAGIPLIENNILRLNTLIKETAAVEGLLYAVIVDRHGIIKAHTDSSKIGKPYLERSESRNARQAADVTYYAYVSATGEQSLDLTRSVLFQKKKLGSVHVGVSIDFIEQLIHKAGISIVIVTLPVIGLGILFALIFGYRFSMPISELVKATWEIAKGNFQYKIKVNRNDELGKLASAFNTMSEELWLKSMMKRSFGKYVGTNVLNMIMANPEAGWLKGHQIQSTILFTDIRGFTAFSETREPVEVVEKLNECFEIQTRLILKQSGYVDKFIGDAILGVFGAPVYMKNHTERALNAALDIRDELKLAGSKNNQLFGTVGIGIDTGTVVSGNIGTEDKMEYTVIGDPVNLASRLSGLAEPGEIVISEAVYAKLSGQLEVVKLEPQIIKGKAEPVKAYRVIGKKFGISVK